MDRLTLLRCLLLFAAASSASLSAAEKASDLHKRLKDPARSVRKQAALKLAERKDAAAIPVLIDLLAELPDAERASVEEMLKRLAGDWAPILQFDKDDANSRRIRRHAWASWWRRSDGPMLLAALGKHSLTPEKRRKLQQLLAQLGSDDFKLREEASEQLLEFGRLALPQLRETVKDHDPEAARRAKILIERIETRPDVRLPIEVLRLLAVRKPAGVVEALLAYLPFAEDEIREDEVRKSLVVLARRDGKLDAALRRALADAQGKVRSVAAEALIEGGGVEGRAAVRKLFREDAPSIRLRLALALARAGEREGVSALIELLPLISAEEYARAEEALYRLAGDSAPAIPKDAESDDKKKCRDAWAAWWKSNAGRIDPSLLRVRPRLGYTVICDNGNNRVFEIDRNGKQLWSISGLRNPNDAVVLPGNRVLITEYGGYDSPVTERDFNGKILWQWKSIVRRSAQRLPNGHTLIASNDNGKPTSKVVEVDRAGKEIYSIHLAVNIRRAHRRPQGEIVCLTSDNQCRLLDTTGKELKAFAIGDAKSPSGCLDLGSNGHILCTRSNDRHTDWEVEEFDREGRLLLRLKGPGVERLTLTGASLLPNGHVLVTYATTAGSKGSSYVYELDRSGKIVWQYKGTGNFIRARRR